MTSPQNIINHVVLTLDASSSMGHLQQRLIDVADAQVAYLARRSQELDQETRITVYTFADSVQCVVYDKDVLRLPSIREYYRTGGMTALVDATVKSLDDLAETPERYGDHSFLIFALTDGAENVSRRTPAELATRLQRLPDNWTVAVLVPDQRAAFEAKRFGFPAANISVWDVTSARGLTEAGETIRRATDNFMVGRASGIRGTKTLFSMDADTVNMDTVQAAGLAPLTSGEYMIVPVPRECVIKEFVEECGFSFKVGRQYYQLSKVEKIQAMKQVAVVEKATGKVFTGAGARDLLGLPGVEVRVRPDKNPRFDVFVQSTSVNRKLMPGTKLLVLT